MLPPGTLARIAGPLYLLLIVAAAFALSVRSAVVEPHTPAATADNIRASATVFRVSFVVDLIANLVYLGWLLTTFLAPDAPAGIGSALLAVAGIGEGAFVVWLVVKSIRLPAAAPARSIPNHDPA